MARLSRRRFVLGAAAALAARPALAAEPLVHKRKIPRTGEELPCVGLGTWQTFDVGADSAARAPLLDVLRRFVALGGAVVDSSPMYGRAEQVVGDLVGELGARERLFLATKVWTTGKERGLAQMQSSATKMRAGRVDLMQIHNLLDWRTHLPTLREHKAAGRIRYLGATHYQLSALDELERIVRTEQIDFVQLPYSVATRDAERRLLPAAKDTGTAVLVMRPFEEGALFRRVKGRDLPAWASEVGATSWAQLFLKFILSHDAVTCPIPATSKLRHLEDDMGAGLGPTLTAGMRDALVRLVA